jgi:hypothetical protein
MHEPMDMEVHLLNTKRTFLIKILSKIHRNICLTYEITISIFDVHMAYAIGSMIIFANSLYKCIKVFTR